MNFYEDIAREDVKVSEFDLIEIDIMKNWDSKDDEGPSPLNVSGHTEATTMTSMSDGCDFEENQPTFVIQNTDDSFDSAHGIGAAVINDRNSFCELSDLSSLGYVSLGSFFCDYCDDPRRCFDINSSRCSSTSDFSLLIDEYIDVAVGSSIEGGQEPVPSWTEHESSFSSLPPGSYTYDDVNNRIDVSSKDLFSILDWGKMNVTSPVPSNSRREHSPTKSMPDVVVDSETLAAASQYDNVLISGQQAKSKEKRCRRKEPLQKVYVDITDKDVLLGRGGRSHYHPGNVEYRRYILQHQRAYKNLENSHMKTQMSFVAVAWVKNNGGRFLKRDDKAPGQPFYIATDETARQKVSQALREDHTPEGREQKKFRTKAYQIQSDEHYALEGTAFM